MEFTLSTIGISSSSLPSSSVMGRRRRLAPPCRDTLPRFHMSVPGKTCTCEGNDTIFRTILISFLRNSLFSQSTNSVVTKKTPKTKTLQKRLSGDEDEDDDTASTVSASTSTDSLDEEEDCVFSARKSVSFSYPLVTAVHTRPTTTLEDKYYLHYSDVDFLDFKIGFVTGRDRTRKVSFAREVVSQVASIPSVSEDTRPSLYYSELELQRFLDEFVKSLHQRL